MNDARAGSGTVTTLLGVLDAVQLRNTAVTTYVKVPEGTLVSSQAPAVPDRSEVGDDPQASVGVVPARRWT